MTRTVLIAAAAIATLALASAGHVKPGLWNVTTTTRYVGVDKFPAIVIGKLAAQGIVFPSRPQTVTKAVCISPDNAAIDRLPPQNEDNGACEAMTFETTAEGYTGKSVCRTYLEGRVWFEVNFTGDAHYEGKTVFKGKSYGLAMETWNTFSGEWSNADCSVAP